MQNFHDDPHLAELLAPDKLAQLTTLLQQMAELPVQVSDRPVPGASAVEFNLAPLAWLQCPSPARQQAAARLLEFVLHYVGKYRLAANMYRDSTEESFDELQRQNEALRVSEERYRELSRQLQERVQQQVSVIEHAQQHLYESARLRSIGQLAAGVAHEINNPVGFISSNLQVAEEYVEELARLPGTAPVADLLRDFRALIAESASGVQRIAAIVADLKTFSNIDRAEFIACDLNQLLVAACNLLQAEYAQQLVIERQQADLPVLTGYPARLSQAFYNVLDNAARALGPGGRIQVLSARTPEGVELRIADDGCGIPAAVQPRIFDPFFSTRGVGGGIGLGLTVARDIVLAHDGSIRVESEDGCGTTVILHFPVR